MYCRGYYGEALLCIEAPLLALGAPRDGGGGL